MVSKLIAPSILAADFVNLEKEVKAVAQAGADWLHVDVMDGHFVNNISIGIPVVQSLKKISPLPLDVHLMIEKPERYAAEFIKAGADLLTIHVESTAEPLQLLRQIRQLGAKAGITLRPGTAIENVLPFLAEVDLVLVMSVEPGFGGQEFREDQVPKLSRLKHERQEQALNFLIEIDGGVNQKTRRFVEDADVIVAGSAIFKNSNYADAIRALR